MNKNRRRNLENDEVTLSKIDTAGGTVGQVPAIQPSGDLAWESVGGVTPSTTNLLAGDGSGAVIDSGSDPSDFAAVGHNHDALYAALGHNHDALYAALVHGHAGADITSGTVDVARLPVGTGATQVAAGDHTHAGLYVIDVTSYGAVPNDGNDDYTAIKDAIVALEASTTKAVLYFPPGTYNVKRYVGGAGTGVRADLEINATSDFIVSGYGATIDFAQAAPVARDGTNEPLDAFRFVGCSRFMVEGFELDGAADQWTRSPVDRAEGFGFGIYTRTCTDFVIRDVYAHHWCRDGLYIGGGDAGTADRNGFIMHCRCNNNARNGLTIIQARGVNVIGGEYNQNGVTGGAYGNHPPATGIDVEPNYGTAGTAPTMDVLTGEVTIDAVTMYDNVGDVTNPYAAGLSIGTVQKCETVRCVNSYIGIGPNSEVGFPIYLGGDSMVLDNCRIDGYVYVGPFNTVSTYGKTKNPATVMRGNTIHAAVRGIFLRSNCYMLIEGNHIVGTMTDAPLSDSADDIYNDYFPYLWPSNTTSRVRFLNNHVYIPAAAYQTAGAGKILNGAFIQCQNIWEMRGNLWEAGDPTSTYWFPVRYSGSLVVTGEHFANAWIQPYGTAKSTFSTSQPYDMERDTLGAGILKESAYGVQSVATSGTDYAPGTSTLATGIVKSTTGTGALSIAAGSDLPTHTHSGSDITDGTVGKAYGGAGDVSGIMKAGGDGVVAAATSGTDYSAGTSGLATGLLKSTTGTGALSIAVAGDIPDLSATYITKALVDAKGDLITASAADTPARLAVGSEGQYLIADPDTSTGLNWGIPDWDERDMATRFNSGNDLKAWTYPCWAAGGYYAATDGNMQAHKIYIPHDISVTGMVIFMGDVLLTNPDNENALALFDSTGTLIGKTADQATAWGTTTAVPKWAALTGGPYALEGGPGAYVYGVVLVNTSGATPPKFLTRYTISGSFGNLGQTGNASSATWTHGYKASATIPAGANGLLTLTAGGYPFWLGLY